MRHVNMVYDDTMTRERLCTEVGFADPVINGVLALYAFSKRPNGSRYGVHYAYVLFSGSIEERARMLYDGRIGRTDIWEGRGRLIFLPAVMHVNNAHSPAVYPIVDMTRDIMLPMRHIVSVLEMPVRDTTMCALTTATTMLHVHSLMSSRTTWFDVIQQSVFVAQRDVIDSGGVVVVRRDTDEMSSITTVAVTYGLMYRVTRSILCDVSLTWSLCGS